MRLPGTTLDWISIITILLLAACNATPRDLTVVSGKTVSGGLALEGVAMEIYRWEQSRWRSFSETKSGYHGSFRVHLPPGEYRLTAVKTFRTGSGELFYYGTLENLVVGESVSRVDQVVIQMEHRQQKPEGP